MLSHDVSMKRREHGRKHSAMKSYRPICTARRKEGGEIVRDERYIDGNERNSAGVEKGAESAPHGVIARRGRGSPAVANEAEGVVGEGETVQPPIIFQARRGRWRRGGAPETRSTTPGTSGRRQTSSTRRPRSAGYHFWAGQNGVTRRKTPMEAAILRTTRGRRGGGGNAYATGNSHTCANASNASA